MEGTEGELVGGKLKEGEIGKYKARQRMIHMQTEEQSSDGRKGMPNVKAREARSRRRRNG